MRMVLHIDYIQSWAYGSGHNNAQIREAVIEAFVNAYLSVRLPKLK